MSTFWVNQHVTKNNSVNYQTAETAQDSSCQGLSEEGGWNRVSVLQDEENPTSSQWVVMAPQQYGYTTQVHS